MRVSVIGNGLTGTLFSKALRDIDEDVDIEIFADEKHLYYPRPNLIEFLAGNLSYERLFAFPESWYEKKNIKVHLETPVEKILPGSQELVLKGGKKAKFDILLLANGSYAFVPPFKGAEKKGVFTLRTLEDTLDILNYMESRKKAVVIGGGLLGLEIARAVKARGVDVDVVEFFPYLLPRQLDPEAGDILREKIEKMGIRVHLGLATDEIMGTQEARGLRFKEGGQIETEMAIVAAGVRPEIELAKEAGLETDRGVVVNDYLQTSHPKIFAAGDNIQHKGRWYGIIPASFEQSRVAANNVASPEEKYEGTIASNTLKIVGLYVTSIGVVNPEEAGLEQVRKHDPGRGIYKKIVLDGGKIVGAIWMGTKEGVGEINRLITQKKDVSKWKDSLLENDFDFSVL